MDTMRNMHAAGLQVLISEEHVTHSATLCIHIAYDPNADCATKGDCRVCSRNFHWA